MKRYTNQTASYFQSLGIGHGDMVMLILKRRYEFWFSIIALHKIGAVAIPATHLLTGKDIVYRNNAADIKAIVCTTDGHPSSREKLINLFSTAPPGQGQTGGQGRRQHQNRSSLPLFLPHLGQHGLFYLVPVHKTLLLGLKFFVLEGVYQLK